MRRAKLFCRALGCGLLAIAFAAPAHAQCQLNSPSGDISHTLPLDLGEIPPA